MMGVEDSFKRYDLTKQITASAGNILDVDHSRVSTALCCHLKILVFVVYVVYLYVVWLVNYFFFATISLTMAVANWKALATLTTAHIQNFLTALYFVTFYYFIFLNYKLYLNMEQSYITRG